ncbi:aldehyde dehydrogenase family protein [Subtercola lobariae]|uniref:Gamma-aminobutyraldehyde dehydrogenase n=1 Tax=Subtercola lobariae TaxID=1588641 RepID=A0A917F0X3_9MICO|nr:aldehyde dehydrogenase family protein [Subtercola lobariae]GGF33880.1 gamma-aminobutyraldehyde dehydrogenase [Subtercola lobariae]
MSNEQLANDQRTVVRDFSKRVIGNFIDNRWAPSTSADQLVVVDPSTGLEIGRVPASSAVDVDVAVSAAAAAQPAWARLTPAARANYLLELATLVEQHIDELVVIEAIDAGKPITAAKEEMHGVVDAMRFFAGSARSLPAPAGGDYLDGVTSVMRREPVGVVAGITPWNYPLLQAVAKLFPALATGNTVVIKPAETTPYSTAWLAEFSVRVLPPGVFNVVFGTGHSVGEALTRHPDVDLVSFTGSIEAGRKVGIAAADGVKKAIMELGGNAPVIVFDDAALDSAVDAIVIAGLYNTGQECMAASRLIVHSSIVEKFTEALIVRCTVERIGDVLDQSTTLGPMTSASQRTRVLEKIERRSALSQVVTGGTVPAGEGFYFPPTIITGVSQDDELVQEEIFGPVFTIQTFDSENEALLLANGTRYGLAASVFTTDVGRSIRVQNALDFGTVWVNTHLVFAADLPVSGFGSSGIGTENAELGVIEFTRLKHVMIDQH